MAYISFLQIFKNVSVTMTPEWCQLMNTLRKMSFAQNIQDLHLKLLYKHPD